MQQLSVRVSPLLTHVPTPIPTTPRTESGFGKVLSKHLCCSFQLHWPTVAIQVAQLLLLITASQFIKTNMFQTKFSFPLPIGTIS